MRLENSNLTVICTGHELPDYPRPHPARLRFRKALWSLAAFTDRRHPALVLLPWLPCAISILLIKYQLLTLNGFHESTLGLRTAGTLTLLEKVSLFHSDLLLCFGLIPAALAVIVCLLPSRTRLALSATFALLVEAGVCIETAGYNATGTFASGRDLWAALVWVTKSRDTAIVNIPAGDAVSLSIWMLLVGLCTASAFIALRRSIRWVNKATMLVFVVGVAIGLITSLPRIPEVPWTHPLLQTVCRSVFGGASVTKVPPRSIPELLRIYREATLTPESAHSQFFGQARGYNVLLFVMEAMPAQVFDPAGDELRDMPNLRRLRAHSFVAARHYTTFPATNRAVFSLFTSLFTKEPEGTRVGSGVALPGMARTLATAGYETGYYGYVWRAANQRDDQMLASLGFNRIVEATIDGTIDREGAETFQGSVTYVERHDVQVLGLLRQDIRRWAAAKRRFATVFFPELSHDPWRSLDGGNPGSLLERGRALAAHQDKWLGELLEELARDGVLEHTIIVVTSDHGLRFIAGANGKAAVVSRGKLDELTMRVPLLVSVPKVVKHAVTIHCPTSHIDLMPTVLDLLGVTNGRELEQGVAIWNPGIDHRRLFLSMETFGAKGFVEGGNYYTSNPMNVVHRSGSLHFSDADVLPMNGEAAIRTRQILEQQESLQNALVAQLVRDPAANVVAATAHPIRRSR